MRENGNEFVDLFGHATLGDILVQEGDTTTATRYYQEFTDYFLGTRDTERETLWLGKIAQILFHQNKHYEAEAVYRRAIAKVGEANLKVQQARLYLQLADLLIKQQKFDEALSCCKHAKELSSSREHDDLDYTYHRTMGDIHRLEGRNKKAIKSYQAALSFFAKTEKALQSSALQMGYTSSKYDVFRKIVDCFYQIYQSNPNPQLVDSLYYYDQLSRGRTMRSLWLDKGISTQSSFNRSPDYVDLCNQMETIQRAIRLEVEQSGMNERGLALVSDAELLKHEIIEYRLHHQQTDIQAYNDRTAIPSPNQLKRLLRKRKSGYLCYHLSPYVSFVTVIANSKVTIIPLDIDYEEMKLHIMQLLSPFWRIASGEEIQYLKFRADLAFELYQALVAPVEDHVILPKNVIIQPDDILYYLPFDLLLTTRTARTSYTPVDPPDDYPSHFLIHRYSMTFTQIPHMVYRSTRPISKRTPCYVFSNPVNGNSGGEQGYSLRTMMGWRFQPLPFAEREAFKLRDIIPKATIHTQAQATETALRQLSGKGLLHIASHGFVDYSFDLFSGIVLAHSDYAAHDGLLMGYELADMNSEYDLVTLNMCDSGRGKMMAGEGLLGLTRFFLASGAKSVVMTNWKVDDSYSEKVMIPFYQNIIKRGYAKADALHRAKLAIIRTQNERQLPHGQHPFFWAAYSLYGDPGVSRRLPMYWMGFAILAGLLITFWRVKKYRK